jgi:hypothetical protein
VKSTFRSIVREKEQTNNSTGEVGNFQPMK